jgi:FkbM family methyltransferase
VGYKIKEILGSKMYLIPTDGGLSKQLLENGIREIGCTVEIRQILKKHWTVIDIGANLGYYALLETRHTNKVYAIEPVQENVRALEKSIKHNDYKNIDVYGIAISDKDGNAKFVQTKRSNCGTLMLNSLNPKPRKAVIDVKTKTLDTFCKEQKIERVDFIRTDTEGGEVEIVKGMANTVKLMPEGSILCIEIHPKVFGRPFKPILTMLDTLKAYGFEPLKYILIDLVVRIENYGHLKRLLDNKYCPQIFFEKI